MSHKRVNFQKRHCGLAHYRFWDPGPLIGSQQIDVEMRYHSVSSKSSENEGGGGEDEDGEPKNEERSSKKLDLGHESTTEINHMQCPEKIRVLT